MKIRRSRPTVEWTQVPNVVARDYRLSWRARGLLVELLSYPPGWEITIDELVKRAQRQAQMLGGKVEGRDAMRAAARELKAVGYLVATKYQDERGRWHTVVEVTDAPMWNLLGSTPPSPTTDDGFPVVGATSGEHHVSAGHTDDGFPGVGSPGVGIPGVSRKKERKKETPPPSEVAAADEARVTTETPQEEEEETDSSKDDGAMTALAAVDEATALWGGHRLPTPTERVRLAERAAQAIAKGARRADVVHALSRDLSDARSAVAVVMARTKDDGWWRNEVAPAAVTPAPRPKWCGVCDGRTRQREDAQGRPYRCPECHPLRDITRQDDAEVISLEASSADDGDVIDLRAYR